MLASPSPKTRQPIRIALITLLLLAGVFYFYSGQQRDRYQEPVRRYLTEALADIGSWQPEAIERHLSTEARQAISDEQLAALAGRYRDLGAFEALSELEFARISTLSPLLGGRQLLSYSGTVRFSNGSARLAVTLITRGDRFRIYNFNLSSPQNGSAP